MASESEAYFRRLRADAGQGSEIATRFLLLAYAQSRDYETAAEFLDEVQPAERRHFLEAELGCFHGYPATKPWQELLLTSAESGDERARSVIAFYREWARGSASSDESQTRDRDDDHGFSWTPPEWSEVLNGRGVVVSEHSTASKAVASGYG